MGVGSLHSPREYDGRPPPDAGYYLDLVIPRKEEPRKKKHVQVRITTCKNITNKVANLHAIQFQIISKCTSNTSKNTSRFTSKTNQIRLGGPWGGLTPPYGALLFVGRGGHGPWACFLRSCSSKGATPKGNPAWGGGIHSREGSYGVSCSTLGVPLR